MVQNLHIVINITAFDKSVIMYVVVFLTRHMEGMGRFKFSDLYIELPVLPQVSGVVGTVILSL